LKRVLLGSGATPWEALVELARQLRAERASDASVLRASEDVQMRLMHVTVASSGVSDRWVVEATWVVG
jgi:hypothetical protein